MIPGNSARARLDNGCNAALVIDALRAIKASGVKPRRTIRLHFVFRRRRRIAWFPRAYAFNHRAELDKGRRRHHLRFGHWGTTTGFSLGGRKDVVYTAKDLIAPLAQFGVKEVTTGMEWGTDHFDFMLEGVPTFVADQDEANYLENYHAISDTYDKVDFAQLKKHVAEAAALSVEIADLPERSGRALLMIRLSRPCARATAWIC